MSRQSQEGEIRFFNFDHRVGGGSNNNRFTPQTPIVSESGAFDGPWRPLARRDRLLTLKHVQRRNDTGELVIPVGIYGSKPGEVKPVKDIIFNLNRTKTT